MFYEFFLQFQPGCYEYAEDNEIAIAGDTMVGIFRYPFSISKSELNIFFIRKTQIVLDDG